MKNIKFGLVLMSFSVATMAVPSLTGSRSRELIVPLVNGVTDIGRPQIGMLVYNVPLDRLMVNLPNSGWATIAFGATSIAAPYSTPTTPYIRLNSGQFATTYSKIRTFDQASAITTGQNIDYIFHHNLGGGAYGDDITILTPGFYQVSYSDTGGAIGITVNENVASTGAISVTSPSVLSTVVASVSASTSQVLATITLRLKNGDVVRAHTDGTQPGNLGTTQFIMTWLHD